MCSTRLLQLITNEFAELWIHIDFLPFKELRLTRVLEKRNAQLTDEMFATLLTRVNARETTRFLHMQGCTKIVGPGVEPLIGSRILEHITLPNGRRDEGMDELNEALVIDILHSTIPRSFCQVNLTRYSNVTGMTLSYFSDGGVLAERRAEFLQPRFACRQT
jgi:hypothetical protein